MILLEKILVNPLYRNHLGDQIKARLDKLNNKLQINLLKNFNQDLVENKY